MSSQTNVTLRFVQSGANAVSAIFDRLSHQKDDLTKPVDIPIKADDTDAAAKLEAAKAQIDDLSKKRATITVAADDSDAKAKLLALDLRLKKLSEYVARPSVSLRGIDSTLLGIAKIDAAMDALNRKSANPESKSGISKLLSLFGGGGGGGGGGRNGYGILAALPGSTEALINPYTVTAALASLPFLGQLVSGVGVLGLGGGLAGLGVAGAFGLGNSTTPQQLQAAQLTASSSKTRVTADQEKLAALLAKATSTPTQIASARATLTAAQGSSSNAQAALFAAQQGAIGGPQEQLRKAFSGLANNAVNDLQVIGTSFVPVMQSLLSTAQNYLTKITPVFSSAIKSISGPFSNFIDTIVNSLSEPAVVKSINAVAQAFGAVLNALAPSIPSIIQTIADGITRMSEAIAKNPKAFADMVTWLLKVVGYLFDFLSDLTDVANYVEQHFVPAFEDAGKLITAAWKATADAMTTAWDSVWTETIGRAIQGGHQIESAFDGIRSAGSSAWGGISGAASDAFDKVTNYVSSGFDKWWASNGSALEAVWDNVWGHITDYVKTSFDTITAIVGTGWKVIDNAFTFGLSMVSAAWSTVWGAMVIVVKAAWSLFGTVFEAAFQSFVTVFTNGLKIVESLFKQVWDVLSATFKVVFDTLIGIFTVAIDLMTGHWSAAWQAMENVFKQVVNAVWALFQQTGNNIVNLATETGDLVARVFKTAWDAVGNTFKIMWTGVLEPAFKLLIDTFLNIVSAILNGAARAFGWVPDIGGKLKNAAAAFNQFKDNVNNSLNGINNKTVNVSVAMTASTNPYPGGISGRAATGGKISGPGSGTSDTAGLYALSNGEWVVRASSASKYGHAAMNAVNQGQAIIHYASGGPAGVSVNASTPSQSTINNDVWSKVVSLVKGTWQSGLGGGQGSSVPVAGYGAGVAQWAGVVRMALAMEGLSQSLANQVLYQIQTESGGNPNAQNNWDSNAAAGDPSRGLLQTIMSTFLAYHWPGTSWNIFDPLANIAAAINYARHVYGPSLMSGGMGLGSGHGYALGTNSATPGWHMVGERGPEMVRFGGGETVTPNNRLGGGGRTYVINIDGNQLSSPADMGRIIVEKIRQFERGSGKGWRS